VHIAQIYFKHNELRRTYTTDGAAKGNPGKGGYSSYGERKMGKTYSKEFYEGFRLTTNNRMELLAVIVGLEN
jgi:ribonuclease HI